MKRCAINVKRNVQLFVAAVLFVSLAAHCAQQNFPDDQKYSLSDAVRIELPQKWRKLDRAQQRPPAGLAPHAPFQLSATVAFVNSADGSIVQFATSNNPLLGHDLYWLDTQMHSPGASGMSLQDFLFSFFLPPSISCMDEVSHRIVNASRVSAADPSPSSTLEISYACPLASALPESYAASVTAGINFRSGTTGDPRGSGAFAEFYLAPMEQVDSGGMTFFVFEAQEINRVSGEATTYFDLPEPMGGVRADFFWAIGAPSPFPFVEDSSTDALDAQKAVLIHVAYASPGMGTNKRSDFISLLHQVHARSIDR